MKTATLGELCEITVGRTPPRADVSFWGSGAPWLSIADMKQGQVITTTKEQITAGGARAGKCVQPGTVLLSFKLSIGKVAVAGIPLYTNEAIAALPIKDPMRLDAAYLLRALESMELAAGSNRAAMGATLNKAKLRTIAIPLPPLAEQRRIAAILDHADALRIKRRQALAHLDTLTQSIYQSMFNEDPGTTRTLAEVADFFGGTSLPSGLPFSGQPKGTFLMKVSDMNLSGNEDEVVAAALWTDDPTARSATVGPGAVVLPKRGASISTNKKRLTVRTTALDPNLMGIAPKQSVVMSRYLYEWFRQFDLTRITSGSTVPQLNKRDLAPLRIPVPSMARQNDLCSRLRCINTARSLAQRALAADNELFASLQARAFRGEL